MNLQKDRDYRCKGLVGRICQIPTFAEVGTMPMAHRAYLVILLWARNGDGALGNRLTIVNGQFVDPVVVDRKLLRGLRKAIKRNGVGLEQAWVSVSDVPESEAQFLARRQAEAEGRRKFAKWSTWWTVDAFTKRIMDVADAVWPSWRSNTP